MTRLEDINLFWSYTLSAASRHQSQTAAFIVSSDALLGVETIARQPQAQRLPRKSTTVQREARRKMTLSDGRRREAAAYLAASKEEQQAFLARLTPEQRQILRRNLRIYTQELQAQRQAQRQRPQQGFKNAPPPVSQPLKAETSQYCRNCEAEIVPDSDYCTRCGIDLHHTSVRVSEPQKTSPVEYPQKFCRLCGANLIAESKFCANCGQPIYEAPTTIQETDYVDLRPQSAAQPVYQQQEYYQQEYQQPQSTIREPSTPDPEAYPPAPAAPFSATPTPQQAPVPVYMADRKNPGVAAVLSFFWAGLGQIYNGQLAKGFGFIVLYACCVLLIFVVIGFILVPIVWIIGIWDAYNTAKQYNERQLQNERLYYESLRR